MTLFVHRKPVLPRFWDTVTSIIAIERDFCPNETKGGISWTENLELSDFRPFSSGNENCSVWSVFSTNICLIFRNFSHGLWKGSFITVESLDFDESSIQASKRPPLSRLFVDFLCWTRDESEFRASKSVGVSHLTFETLFRVVMFTYLSVHLILEMHAASI